MNRYFQLLKALAIVLGLFSCQNQADKVSVPQIQVHERAAKANIRGLYLVNDSIGWASGTGGTFLRMTDGENWVADSIDGYTHLDFRDVHAFDANTALLMAAGEEGRILRTEDGGLSWVEVYTRLDSGIFLDGMDFQGTIGYCFGDPMDGKFVVLRSEDQGKTWTEISTDKLPLALAKEAGFAASGTGVLITEKMRIVATGGDSVARVMRTYPGQDSWEFFNTPIRSAEGCGTFSLCEGNQVIVAVGGCYLDSTSSEANCAVSEDWGETWQLIAENQPRGYRSCVAASTDKKLLVTCGRTGVDYSVDNGYNWISLSDDGYYTCALADSTGWLMGKRGKMAKLSW
ncbi:MAG: hypothetical protein RL266_1955 [Bacteroidota bacterium]|jgi:photosystem II stability/assembly factor-like uncharacterized protein